MTRAGERILNRKTIVTHVPTGIVVSIDNMDIPMDERPRTHRQQRDEALSMLSEKIGADVFRNQCMFEFLIV